MKKILTFIVSFFTLALFVVSLTQPMNASAAGDTEVSLDFTEEGGNFFAFDGGQYSSTGKIKVEIKGLKSGDQASLTLSYDTAQLVVGALEGIKNNDFVVDNGKIEIVTDDSEFVIPVKVAAKSRNIYGVPFAVVVEKFESNKVVAEDSETYAYFVRGQYGDVNCDGKIDLVDYSAIKNVILGKEVKVNGVVADVSALADVNHDGYANFSDYREIFNAYTSAISVNSKIDVNKYSDAGYCQVLVKEEGKADAYVSVKFGDEYNGQVITGSNQELVIPNDPEKEYAVNYFFSTAIDAVPVVQYVEAGDPVELIINNGTLLYNGFITWYRFINIKDENGNIVAGKFEKIYAIDGFEMPEEDVYLYAIYKDQFKPTLSYIIDGKSYASGKYDKVYDFFTVVKADEINSINNNDENSNGIADLQEYVEGHEFGGWFKDATCKEPVTDFEILGDTKVYALIQPRNYEYMYYKNNGEAELPQPKKVQYGTKLTAPEVVRPGFIFLGWYEKDATEEFVFDTMPARDVTIYAKWYDVVKDGVDKFNEKVDGLGIKDYLYASYADVEEVKDVNVVLNVDKAIDFNGNVDTSVLEGLLAETAKYIGDTYTDDVVAKIEVNGYTVYQNGVIYNKNVKLAIISILNSCLTDIANATVKDVVIELNDSRKVYVKPELKGSPENIAKVREYAGKVADHVTVYFNAAEDTTVVEVVLPYIIVEKVEQKTGLVGEDLVKGVNTQKVGQLIKDLGDIAKTIDPAKLALVNSVVAKLSQYADFADHIDYQKDIEILLEGQKINASSNAKNLEELINEILASNFPILDMTMAEFYDEKGYHSFNIQMNFNFEEVDQLQTKQFVEYIEVRVYFYQKEYSITFMPEGGDLVIPDQDGLVVDGYNVKGEVSTDVEYTISRKNYIFKGWALSKDGAVVIKPNETVEIPYGNKVYYAVWEPVNYGIVYTLVDENGDYNGTSVPTQPTVFSYNIESGDALGYVTLYTPERKGFNFTGWLIKDQATDQWVKLVDGKFNAVEKAKAEETVEVKATWESKKFTVYYSGYYIDQFLIVNKIYNANHNVEKGYISYYDEFNFIDQLAYQGKSITEKGHYISEWEYMPYEDYLDGKTDWETVKPDVAVNIIEDIVVRPIFEECKYTISFDANDDDLVNDAYLEYNKQDIYYEEFIADLPEVSVPGYEFLGWYVTYPVVDEITLVTTYQTDKLTVGYQYLIPQNVEAHAQWKVIDVVENAVNNVDAFLQGAIVKDSLVKYPYEITMTKDTFTKNGENVELVNYVRFDILAAELLAVNNYQLNEEAFLNLFGKIAEAVAFDKTLVDSVTYKGVVVFENGKIVNDACRALLLDLISGSVEELGKGNVPSIEVVIDETVCDARNVLFEIGLVGDASVKQKVKDLAKSLASYISMTYDEDQVDVEVVLPQSVILAIEERLTIIPDHLKVELPEAIKASTIGEVLDLLADESDKIVGSHKDITDAISKLVAKLRKLINQVADEDLVKIKSLNNISVFKEDAEFNPADETLPSVIAALKGMLTPEFAKLAFAEFAYDEPGKELWYTIPLYVEADLTASDMFKENVIEDLVNLTIIFDTNDYEVKLNAAEGYFGDDDTDKYRVLTGKVNELIVAETPNKPFAKFVGWFDALGNKVDKFTNKDIELFAKYEWIDYELEFVANPNKAQDGDFVVEFGGVDYKETYTHKYFDVTDGSIVAVPESVQGWYEFAGWEINGQLVSDASGVINSDKFENAVKANYKDESVVVNATWVKAKFTAYAYNEGENVGYTNKFEYKTLIEVQKDVLGGMYFTKEGHTQTGWLWVLLEEGEVIDNGVDFAFSPAFKQKVELLVKDLTYPNRFEKDEKIEVLGNICVVPLWEGNTITVELNANTKDAVEFPAEVVDQKVYVKYEGSFDKVAYAKDAKLAEFVNSLPVPTRSGYLFDGWYIDGVAADASYPISGAEFADSKVELKAEWVEIVQDAYDKVSDVLKDIVGNLVDTDATKDIKDIDGKDLITEVEVKVNVNSILDGTASVDESKLADLPEKIAKYVEENYSSVESVKLNGAVVLNDHVLDNEQIAKFKNEYIALVLDQNTDITKAEFLPDIKVEIKYEGKSEWREVLVEFTTDTNDLVIDKLNDTKDELSQLFKLENGEYTIYVPQEIVKQLEKAAYAEAITADPNKEVKLEDILAEMTVGEILDKLDVNTIFSNPDTIEIVEKLAKFAYKYEGLTNAILGNDIIKSDLIIDGAYYAPADNTVAAAIQELKSILSISNKKLKELEMNKLGSIDLTYTHESTTTYDASSLGKSTAPYQEVDTIINIVFEKNSYTVKLYVEGNSTPVQEIESKVGLLVTPDKAKFDALHVGYGFVRWYYKDSGGLTLKGDEGFNFIMADSDLELVCEYVARDYNVTLDPNYELNGLTNVKATVNGGDKYVVSVDYDATYDQLPTPVRTYYNFEGWFLVDDKGNVTDTQVKLGDKSNLVAGDHTLAAKWSAKKYDLSVYYGKDKADLVAISSEEYASINYSDKYDVTAEFTLADINDILAPYSASNIDGFTVSQVLTYANIDEFLNDLAISNEAIAVVVYDAIEYTATYEIDGKAVVESVTYTVLDPRDKVVDLLPELSAKYHVTGKTIIWNDSVVPAELPAADLTVEGVRVDDVYKLQFIAKHDVYEGYFDGTSVSERTLEVGYGDEIDLNKVYTSVYAKHFVHSGWYYIDNNGKPVYVTDEQTLDVTNHKYIESLGHGAVVKVYAEYVEAVYTISVKAKSQYLNLSLAEFTGAKKELDITTKFKFDASAKYIKIFMYDDYGVRVPYKGTDSNGKDIDYTDMLLIEDVKNNYGGIFVTFNSDIIVVTYDSSKNPL